MKKISKLMLSGLVLVGVSCADLNLNPLSTGSSENWYKNETEIEMCLDDLLREDFYCHDSYFYDDDATRRDNPHEVVGGTFNSKSGTATGRWTAMYKGISRAIKVLQALDGGAANGVSETKLNQYKGEAYLMIAMGHATLATYYGDAIINRAGMTLDDAYNATRSPRKEVMEYAYECFDKAAELLPAKFSGRMRPCAAAALGFKARYALFHKDYQIAADAAKACMDLGAFSLHPNYRDLFIADKSDELLFYFKGDVGLEKQVGQVTTNAQSNIPRQFSGHCNTGPSLDLFLSYPCTDGLLPDTSPLFDPRDPFANRDPRCAMTIFPQKTKASPDFAEYEASRYDGTMPDKYPDHFYGDVECNQNPYATRVYNKKKGACDVNSDSRAGNAHAIYSILILRKYVKDTWPEWNKAKLDNIWPILRYAEVLMTYGEAMNELGKCTQEVIDQTFQLVRDRAYNGTGMAAPKIVAGTKEQNRKIFRIERRIEFPYEGIRYRDILRYGIGPKTIGRNVYVHFDGNVWSTNANWNGKTGSECAIVKYNADGTMGEKTGNLTLPENFVNTVLKKWDDDKWIVPCRPTFDEDMCIDLNECFNTGENEGYLLLRKTRRFDEHNYLWPIPASDILVNNNLVQNTGY